MGKSTTQKNRKGVTGQRLMGVFAHPDDEGQIAGIMAKYVSHGAEAFLACATPGVKWVCLTIYPSLAEGQWHS